jgi:hypothetical protein
MGVGLCTDYDLLLVIMLRCWRSGVPNCNRAETILQPRLLAYLMVPEYSEQSLGVGLSTFAIGVDLPISVFGVVCWIIGKVSRRRWVLAPVQISTCFWCCHLGGGLYAFSPMACFLPWYLDAAFKSLSFSSVYKRLPFAFGLLARSVILCVAKASLAHVTLAKDGSNLRSYSCL